MPLRLMMLALAAGLLLVPGTARAKDANQAPLVQEAAACVLASAKARPKPPAGKGLFVRIGSGRIPGTSGGPKEKDVYQLLLRTSAVDSELHTVVVGPKGIGVAEDFYALRKENASTNWRVTDGNGGSATYEAVGKYVDKLVKSEPEHQFTDTPPRPARCFAL